MTSFATADPIVAIATAPGRGAIGIVRVSGRGLSALALALCGRIPAARQATYCAFLDEDGAPIDQGLAIFFPAPHSFTGEDVLELQGHGGPIVLQLLLARCLQAAAQPAANGEPCLPNLRLAQPGEFSQRAYLNDKLDLTQAEAIADLIDASTEAAARSASRSLAGALSEEAQRLRSGLIDLRMLVEATLDFPEEEIDFLHTTNALEQLSKLQLQVSSVLARARHGVLLREGITVVLAGQPNAGKSSLLNALAGAELAIVTPVAGTTRDKVQQTIQIEGVPLHVIDTAGLRTSDCEVEQIGVERAWGAIAQADAVLFLHDLTRLHEAHYRAADADILQRMAQLLARRVTLIDVWNKSDSAALSEQPAGLVVSAKTGAGLDALRLRLLELAGWQAVPEGVFMARQRHTRALAQVQDHLQLGGQYLLQRTLALDLLAEELRLALQALGELTGEFTPDDLLGVIFSRFCIGK